MRASTLPTLRTLAVLSIGLCSPLAFAGKKKKKTKGIEAAPAAVAAPTPDTPGDAASTKFATRLLGASIADFRPSDAGGVKFVYSSLAFLGDNTWKADAYVEIEEERMECVETGKWSMEPADSDKVAVVSWTVDKTDCAGREAGPTVRAKLTIAKDGSVSSEFR